MMRGILSIFCGRAAGAVLAALLCMPAQAAEEPVPARDPAGAPQRVIETPSPRQVPAPPPVPQAGSLRKAGTPSASGAGDAPRLSSCLAPGQVFTLASMQITGWEAGLRPIALSDERRGVRLEELSRQSGRATLRLPPDASVEGGRIYSIVLLKEGSSLGDVNIQGAQLLARAEICPGGAAGLPAAQVSGEIVLTVPLEREASARQLLLGEGYVIRESAQLLSLAQAMFRLAPRPGETLPAEIETLRQLLPEAAVDRNHIYRLSGTPKIYAPSLTGWQAVCASAAEATPIGMIDDGVNAEHPALASAQLSLANFSDGAFAGTDHGTGIAVLLTGSGAPASGDGGLVPRAPLYAADIIGGPESGESGTAYGFMRALDWLMARQVRFINLSLTGPPNRLLEGALQKGAGRGTFFFAAAGNEGAEAPPAYPAAYETVIAVTAIDAALRLYEKANQGDYVEFAAPGVDIWLAKAAGGGNYRSGTSYAVPFVLAAGAVLMREAGGDAEALSRLRAALRAQSKDIGAPGRDEKFGWGLVRFSGACGD